MSKTTRTITVTNNYAPVIDQLLNPSTVLTLQFDNYGNVVVRTGYYDPKTDTYVITPVSNQPPSAAKDTFKVTIGVNITDPNNPESGMLVQRDDEWNSAWDDEIAMFLGGEPFPLGTDPCPAATNSTQGINPKSYVNGQFIGPAASGNGSTLILDGVNQKIIATIPAGARLKYLSLWLPPATTGYAKITTGTGEEYNYTSPQQP